MIISVPHIVRRLTPDVAALFVIAALVAGCASPTPQVGSMSDNQAVTALVEEARSSRAEMRFGRAAAQLERALRIEPANSVLWHELAWVYMDQGSPDQAIQFATKSNTLTRDNDMESANWGLIAQAYTRKGDRNRARRARRKAYTLR